MSKQPELDEILGKSKQIVTTNYAEISKWSALAHLELTEEAKQAILDWHNKQIEELLDRLENSMLDSSIGLANEETAVKWDSVQEAIEAERKQLEGEIR